MNVKPNILIAPLDWGLGHASRCIPLINYLLEKDCHVIIASSGNALALLRKRFPDLLSITVPGYDIRYPQSGSFSFFFFKQSIKLFYRIWSEHKALQQIIASRNIHAVISDNRFGMWNPAVPCVFISHQLFIRSPHAQQIINRINHYFIRRFDCCWAPDYREESNLSGSLSHGNGRKMPHKLKYIGPLSRFAPPPASEPAPSIYDVAAVISGPEPHRSLFEQIILKAFALSKLKTVLISGCPKEEIHTRLKHIEYHSHLGDESLQRILLSSKLIICRPGYSSIMDIATLKKKAILIPTPGQTEQLYLADLHMRLGHFLSVDQADFDLSDAMKRAVDFTGIPAITEKADFRKAVDELLYSI